MYVELEKIPNSFSIICSKVKFPIDLSNSHNKIAPRAKINMGGLFLLLIWSSHVYHFQIGQWLSLEDHINRRKSLHATNHLKKIIQNFCISSVDSTLDILKYVATYM